jgi:hypothetical protein
LQEKFTTYSPRAVVLEPPAIIGLATTSEGTVPSVGVPVSQLVTSTEYPPVPGVAKALFIVNGVNKKITTPITCNFLFLGIS